MGRLILAPGLRLGVATSAHQIEGAAGRGRSIWDTFSAQAGRIADGSSAAVACDHIHRYEEDLALLAELGPWAYRFSVAWPRIQATGAGPADPAGIAFYDRLVDELVERDIVPVVTLYHWDLPQPLQDAGGWLVRDTAYRFAEYAELIAQRLGDRVQWLTMNEPFIHHVLGHLLGTHAPGLRLPLGSFAPVHHQLLGHGLAVDAIRRHSRGWVGLANAYAPAWAVGPDGTRETATESDLLAADAHNAVQSWLFTDPVLLGHYPEILPFTQDMARVVRDGDLALIRAPLDVLGVNYYAPMPVSAPADGDPLPFRLTKLTGFSQTTTGWPIAPEGLYELLIDLRERYHDLLPPIWITENGCAGPESTDDADRIAFLESHLRAAKAASGEGGPLDVRAFFVWSLLDNWDWAEGYRARFGLVHVDFATQARTPRASFRWYRELMSS
jgi:beta-glucosidase